MVDGLGPKAEQQLITDGITIRSWIAFPPWVNRLPFVGFTQPFRNVIPFFSRSPIVPDTNRTNSPLPSSRRRKSTPEAPTGKRRIFRQPNLCQIGAGLCLLLSVVVLGISMPHLADGVSKITDCSWLTAMFMACVFDLSQIAAEFTGIVMPIVGIENRHMKRACIFILVSCTLVSMTMNVRAFLANVHTPFEMVMAFVWGILLPILVLLLCFIASEFLVTSLGNTRRKKR